MRRYDWASGGYDYLQDFGMSPRNAAIAGYIVAVGKQPCTILDAGCGLCPIVPFLPENLVSRYVAFDSSQYVQEHLPYKELPYFEFCRSSFEEFFSSSRDRTGSFDFVLYLGMYGGYEAYARRLDRLLPYAKPGGYVILEAIDEHITDVLSVMQHEYPDYEEIASCSIQIHNGMMSHLTRERFRSVYLYHVTQAPHLCENRESKVAGKPLKYSISIPYGDSETGTARELREDEDTGSPTRRQLHFSGFPVSLESHSRWQESVLQETHYEGTDCADSEARGTVSSSSFTTN